jgi:hypothetical protein
MLTLDDLRKHLNRFDLTDEQLQEMLDCLTGLANTMISMYLSEKDIARRVEGLALEENVRLNSAAGGEFLDRCCPFFAGCLGGGESADQVGQLRHYRRRLAAGDCPDDLVLSCGFFGADLGDAGRM